MFQPRRPQRLVSPTGFCLLAMLWLSVGGYLAAQDADPAAPPPGGEAPPSFVYRKGRIEKDGIVTIFYRTGHDRGAELVKLLDDWKSPKGKISASEPLHLLIVQDTVDNIDLLEKVLDILDTASPQVSVETRIVELEDTADLQIGVDSDYVRVAFPPTFFRSGDQTFNPRDYMDAVLLNQSFQGATFQFSTTQQETGTFGLSLRLLQEQGKAKILSNPTILVESGRSATISSGRKEPIQNVVVNNQTTNITVKFEEVKITATVTPHVIGEDYVYLKVSASVQAVVAFRDIAGQATPLISTRSADTEVTVRDGQEVIIGGLKNDVQRTVDRGLPLLADIPVLGWLFRSHRTEGTVTEIVFYLRPVIMRPGAGGGRPIIRPR